MKRARRLYLRLRAYNYMAAALLLCSLPLWGQYLVPHGPRGAAGFSPDDRANLVAWYEGDLGVSSTGGLVDQWSDQSGNGHHVTATGTVRPDDTSNTQNGLVVITFDGSNDELENASFPDFPDKATIFLVAHQSTEENNVGVLDINNGSTTNTGLSFLREIGLWEFRIRSGSSNRDAEYTAPSAPVSKIWTLWYDADNSPKHEIFENGTSKGTNTGTGTVDNTLSNLVVGALQGNIFHFDGWVSSLIIYSDSLDATDRALVKTYQNDKWAIF